MIVRWQLRVGIALSLSAIITGTLIQHIESIQRAPTNLVYEYPEEMEP